MLVEWKDLDSTRCSVARTAAVVGDGWTVLILRDLFNDVRRFGSVIITIHDGSGNRTGIEDDAGIGGRCNGPGDASVILLNCE